VTGQAPGCATEVFGGSSDDVKWDEAEPTFSVETAKRGG
jgi:hypothetical protein